MERKAHYGVVGLITIALATVMIIFSFWFLKFNFNRSFSFYTVEFDSAVDGLNKGAEVHLNGIKVGQVTQLRLSKANAHQVLADIELDADTPVRTDSIATLAPQGITGLFFIALTPGTTGAPLLHYHPGQTYPLIASQEGTFAKLVQGSGTVMEGAYDSLGRVNRVLSDGNIQDVSTSLKNIAAITDDLKSRQQTLDDAQAAVIAAGKAANAVTVLAQSTNGLVQQRLPATLNGVDAATLKLSDAADSFKDTALAMKAPIDTLQTTTLPQVQSSLRNLNETTTSLRDFVDDFHADPRSILAKPAADERKIEQ